STALSLFAPRRPPRRTLFPTRRSSDLIAGWKFEEGLTAELGKLSSQTGLFPCFRKRAGQPGELKHVPDKERRPPVEKFLALQRRSEEHTSELQSPCNLVCRLLLEKKKA